MVLMRRRRALMDAVAVAFGGAAGAVAGADGIMLQDWCVLAKRDAIRPGAVGGRHLLERRAALEPPKIPRDAVVVVVALRRHAVLPHKKVVVVGELVHETDLEHGVPREFPLDVRTVVVAAQSFLQPRREAAVRS